MTKKYPIAKPYITDKEIEYVTEVLESGLLSLGPRYKEFEKSEKHYRTTSMYGKTGSNVPQIGYHGKFYGL